MSDSQEVREHQERAGQVFEVVIRLGIVLLLLTWGFRIVAPFLHLIVWAVILAVALYPAFRRVSNALGGKPKFVGVLFVAAAITLVVVPTGQLAAGSMDAVLTLAERWQAGELTVPPPPEEVRDLAVVGGRIYELWLAASTNLEALLEGLSPQLQAAGGWLLSLAAGTGSVLLLLAGSLVIGGALMAQGEGCIRFARAFATRLVGDDEAEGILNLTAMTIRGVAMGVIGTAAIQAAAAALGFVLMGIPLAGLWAALVLMLAVIQLPPMLVMLPIAVWSFTSYGTVPAALFTGWCLLVGASDNVLKPILMGRGQDVPMLVLLIGSLGGMLLSGVMGLFVGAVVLAVIYRLFGAWLEAPAAAAVPEG